MPTKVAVIGAGAAGICVLRHALASEGVFEATAFEKSNKLGGTWVYTDKTETDENGLSIHSSMYKNLRTNIPKEVMNFPGFPFKTDLPSFLSHENVAEYLEDYVDHYGLRDHIQFETVVDSVRPSPESVGSGKVKWEVTYHKVGQPSSAQTNVYDGIFVCSGHYSDPLMPKMKGLENFEGKILHSHNYRSPEEFRDLRVVILGAAASGQDICVDMSPEAKRIYLSHNKTPLSTAIPDNVEQVDGIVEVYKDSVRLSNGREIECDAILFCTGYLYSFNFLEPECGVQIEEGRIVPLYKHLVHTTYPTMFFIGMCKPICPFPQFDAQIQFSLKVLDGRLVLPSKLEMDEETETDYRTRLERGLPPRYAHFMGPRQWEYNAQLTTMAGLEPISPNVQLLYEHVHAIRLKQLTTYKRLNFRLTGPDSFEQY
ncbi:flavin-containing monooxygenase FMO GS-OX-like 4 isoform X2 [Aplysia californica]|uniref:Flavin-containing monooxygenase n=1 Tax=Aplysia californica TaxID=6500 RepID=A0ABM1VYI7_APLCA|nr:flavin-containing monooxygenase FMO GS-OX-like 4 isoform X2 [Aplysia californica]